jgi:site-specific DNA-methyltransferase (adenine-specific)
MKPYYQDDWATLYHGDCLEIAPTLTGIDAVISDPPYGMDLDTDNSRFSGGQHGNIARRGNGQGNNRPVMGDDEPFDPSPWIDYPAVVLFGSNHFAATLPVGTTLVWIKRYDEAFQSFLSDAEIAWMKGGHGVYCRRDLTMTAEAKIRRHPCQKPVGIMAWCIRMAKVYEGRTILDPFAGVGTTLVAAKSMGRRSIGIEIEERYCEITAKRLQQNYLEFAE